MSRAELLLAQFEPFCSKAVIVSATDTHIQFRIRRKVESVEAALFCEDTTNEYPFDKWVERQGMIRWTTKEGRFRIGYIDKVKITIIVEG